MADLRQRHGRSRGGSALGFALVLIALVALCVLIFSVEPTDFALPHVDPAALLGNPRTTKPPSSAKEGTARMAPILYDHITYVPLVLR
jgi:hypothetical protein